MKKLACIVSVLVFLALAGNCFAEDAFLSMDSRSIFHFCGLDWNADFEEAVAVIGAATGRVGSASSNGVYSAVSFPPADGSALPSFPGLPDDCCYPIISVAQDESEWWLECQLSPPEIRFATATDAATWFLYVNYSMQEALGLSGVSSVRVEYPDGRGTVFGPDDYSYGDLLATWVYMVDEEGEELYMVFCYNNMELTLEAEDYGDGPFYSCWLMMNPA